MSGIRPRLEQLGAQDVLFVACDVSKVESVQAVHDAVYARWDDCGFLMNNAGVGVGKGGFEGSFRQSLEEWRLTIDVCLYGVVHGHKVFVPTMLARGKPAVIVNTASGAGLFNFAGGKTGDMAYTVAKNGVTLLTESLDAAMRSRRAPISVHLLCPGGTRTNIWQNSAESLTFESAASKQRYLQKLAERSPKITKGFLPVERLPPILQECIEVGRFYCVTPDSAGDINLFRSYMLSRAEDFIADRPPLSHTRREGFAAFKELRKSVAARGAGPIHKL